MSKKTSTLLTSNTENLNRPPHVLPQLIKLVEEGSQSTSDEQMHRWQHLAECVHCQTLLGCYLLKIIADKQARNLLAQHEQELLNRLRDIIHKTLAEVLPAYTEVLVGRGAEEAARRFPIFAEHLRECQVCSPAVRDLQAWLQEFPI